MLWYAVALDTIASLLAVTGTALYVLIPWVKRHAQRWLRTALRNRRAYLLAFECSGAFLSVWGMLGQLVRQYPRIVDAFAARDVDLPHVLEAAGLHLDVRTLDWLRLCLLGMALGCVVAGLLCRKYGRREIFTEIRQALDYAVRRLYAVSYVVVRGGERVVTTALRDGADAEKWTAWLDALPPAMTALSADIRPARQGENVRFVHEVGTTQIHYYRFGAHAYLIASAFPPDAAPIRRGLRRRAQAEVRHLIWAIQSMASAHGA